ncbi:NAD(P)H-binding protein [Georgenia sp. 10Sc9-8]|uniref:NAD(P)H-binding protein n=1 Tax=Georgenia halotolerans TaxID=3028317 RepID=A0ABT5U178_9MICO|nr:NAD(P)H-binding protein [Georgenia halotolerans]
MRVAVAGGTGTVGRHVVRAAQDAGHETVVLARSSGVDLSSGDGVEQALAGVDAVVDVSNITALRRAPAQEFFTTATTHLMAAGSRAGVQHHVVLSIVGVDRVPLGYYQAKRYQERLALVGPVPASVLRATQFYELAAQLPDRVPGPVAVVPRMRSRPVAAREVAVALVALLEREPVGLGPEMAGPEEHDMADLVRRVVQARGQRRRVVGVRAPGAAGRTMASGGLLPTADGPRGQVTFEQWLSTEHPGPG